MSRDRAPKTLLAAAAAGLALAGLAGATYAQPAPEDPPPAHADPRYADPRYAVELTPEEPGRYLHDGWYGRVAAGQGYVATHVAPPDGGGHDTTGATACVDAAAGRTLNGVPGLALGVGLSACFAPEPQSTLSLRPLDALLYVVTLGMTADGYPDPAAGFHVGGEWNFALLSTGEEGSSRAVGPGAALWLGYDAFVAPEWSVGAMLRGALAAAFEGAADPNAPIDTPATIVRVETLSVLFSVLHQ